VPAETHARAAVLEAPGAPLSIEDLTVESPRAGEVLVRLRASGVCHSDLHVRDGDWRRALPAVLGHEGAGVVEAVGVGVTGVREGDHVVLSWWYPCRRCRQCASGRPWICSGTRAGESLLPDGTTRLRRASGEPVRSYLAVGSFGERTVVPESAVVPIPSDVPFDVAALLGCAVATGVGAVVNTAAVPPGASAVVLGLGGVGLSALMGLVAAGAGPIVAVDVSDEKLALARELGAAHAVRGDADVVADVQAFLGGGAEFVFEAIGLAPTIELVQPLLAPGGTGILIGLTPQGVRVSFDAYTFVDRAQRLLGSNYGASDPAVDFRRLAGMYLAGELPLDRLVTHRIALEAVEEAFEAMRRGERVRSVVVYR
jgi:S-(hydroxymethyl)glutathione dehydrogenase/alcohol dehydrogenase